MPLVIDKWPDGGLTAFDIAARGRSSRGKAKTKKAAGSSGGRGRASAERRTPRRRGLRGEEGETQEFIKDNTEKSVGDPRVG